MECRPYQIDCLNILWQSLQIENNHLVSAATGAGKTIIAAKLIQRLVNENICERILFLVDREVLVTQTADKLIKVAPELKDHIGLCCASVSNNKEINKRITIASRQTLVGQLNEFHPVQLCIIDEAHLARIPTIDDTPDDFDQFQTIIARLQTYNPKLRLLGFTATPYRMNQGYIYGDKNTKGCLPYYSKQTFNIGFNRLIADGFLCNIDGKTILSDKAKADIASVKITAGEFNLGMLSDAMSSGIHLQSAVDAWKEHARDRKKTLAFCVTIDHAEKLAEKFNDNGVSAVAIHSKHEKSHTEELMQSLENGEHNIYCSVAKLTTGLDVPDIDCLLACRPTKSTSLWIQMIGRGLRVCHGKKDCKILDLVGNFNEHGTNLDKPKVFYKLTKPGTKKEDEEKLNEKQCPECSFVVHKVCRICPDCNYQFNFTVEAGNQELIDVHTGPIIKYLPVDSFTMDFHNSQNSGKDLLKISYTCINEDAPVYERFVFVKDWCCFPGDGYSGFAVDKMIEKLYILSDGAINKDCYPETVSEFLEDCQDIIDKPKYLKLEMSGEYPDLLKVLFDDSEIPKETKLDLPDVDFSEDVPF